MSRIESGMRGLSAMDNGILDGNPGFHIHGFMFEREGYHFSTDQKTGYIHEHLGDNDIGGPINSEIDNITRNNKGVFTRNGRTYRLMGAYDTEDHPEYGGAIDHHFSEI